MNRPLGVKWKWTLGLVGATALGAMTAVHAAAPADNQAAPETRPQPERVKIIFQTIPPTKNVVVTTGGKKLGVIMGRGKPLIVERARDSGPLDVVLKADGFLTVHTRAYTFTDSRVSVKLTPEEEKRTLFGFREALPPDGGVAPEPAAGTPAGPTDAGVP